MFGTQAWMIYVINTVIVCLLWLNVCQGDLQQLLGNVHRYAAKAGCRITNIVKAVNNDFAVYGIRKDTAIFVLPRSYLHEFATWDAVLTNRLLVQYRPEKEKAAFKREIRAVIVKGSVELLIFERTARYYKTNTQLSNAKGFSPPLQKHINLRIYHITKFGNYIQYNDEAKFITSQYPKKLLLTFSEYETSPPIFICKDGKIHIVENENQRHFVYVLEKTGDDLKVADIYEENYRKETHVNLIQLKPMSGLAMKINNIYYQPQTWKLRYRSSELCFTYSMNEFDVQVTEDTELVQKLSNRYGQKKNEVKEEQEVYPEGIPIGTSFVGVIGVTLFSFKVTRSIHSFDEIIDFVQYSCPSTQGNIKRNDKIFVLSPDGKDTVVVMQGRKGAVYELFKTSVSEKKPLVCYTLDQSKMAKTNVFESVNDAVFSQNILYLFTKGSIYKLEIDQYRNKTAEKVRNKVPFSDLVGAYTNTYDTAISLRPQTYGVAGILYQSFNRRELKRKKTAIVLRSPSICGNEVQEVTLTKRITSVNYVLAFPERETFSPLLAKKKIKYNKYYFGIANCTLFAFDANTTNFTVKGIPKGLGSIASSSSTCDGKKKVRLFMEKSSIYVLLEKTADTVEYGEFEVEIRSCESTFKMSLNEQAMQTLQVAKGSFEITYVRHGWIYYLPMDQKSNNPCSFALRQQNVKSMDGWTNSIPKKSLRNAQGEQMGCDSTIVDVAYDAENDFLMYKKQTAIGDKLFYEWVSSNFEMLQLHKTHLSQHVSETALKEKILSSAGHTLIVHRRTNQPSEFYLLDSEKNDRPILIATSAEIRFIGLYIGVLYKETKPVSRKEIGIIQTVTSSTTPIPNLEAWDEIEKAELYEEKLGCILPLMERPFFLYFIVKVTICDILFTVGFIILVLVHRMIIIPARRRYKIKCTLIGIKKQKVKKMALTRLRKRVSKLNVLIRRRKQKATAAANSSNDSSSSLGESEDKTKQTTDQVTTTKN